METVSRDKSSSPASRSRASAYTKIEKLLRENRQYLEAIYETTEKARRYILWGRIMTLIYLLIIVTPLVLAVIYLPPYIKQLFEPYRQLLQPDGPSVGSSIDEYLKILKNLNP